MMVHHRSCGERRGYTLTVVLLTLILLFGLWTYVIRSTSSLLRIETARSLRQSRDQGAMNAMAQAVQLLQYDYPKDSQSQQPSQKFTYYVTTVVPDASPITNSATTPLSYMVVYSWLDKCTQTWKVEVTPVEVGSVDSTKLLPTNITPPIAWPAGAGQP